MDFLTGDLGAGGAEKCAVELHFSGRLGETFIEFAKKRAARLSLRGWIQADPAGHVTALVEGPVSLVDAFEVACSLGPIDAFVDKWTREARATGLNSGGFERRKSLPANWTHK